MLIVVFCSLEFFYAKYYFTIQRMWHEIRFPWNGLHFAFFLQRFPEPESTLLMGGFSGVGGATVWCFMSRLAYLRGVLFSLAGLLISAFIASLIAWSASFPELLVIQGGQAIVLMAFFTLGPRKACTPAMEEKVVDSRREVQFSLWALLNFIALASVLLVAVRPAMVNQLGHLNLWLPILGVSVGVVTLLFLLSYQTRVYARVVLLALCIPSAAVFGYGIASAFPQLRILWSFYTDAYAPGTFRYFSPAYMVWFTLTGIVAVVTNSIIEIATRFTMRLRSVSPVSSCAEGTTTELSDVANASR